MPGCMTGNICPKRYPISSLVFKKLGKNYLLHKGVETMRLINKINHRGQNLIEYAVIVALIASAMIAMSTYVFRSVQATQQVIQKGYTD